MTLSKIEITCSGITPLIMNRMGAEVLDSIRTRIKKPKSARTELTPRDEAAPKVYQTEDGRPYIPTENLLACLIAAGQWVRLDGKRQVSTTKSTMLPAFLSLEDPFLPLLGEGAQPPKWEVDLRQGRNPNGGEAVCLCRPRFDKWGFKVSALVDTSEVASATIRQLWDIAGRRIGIGDFRPARKGMYGQWIIVKWEAAKEVRAA